MSQPSIVENRARRPLGTALVSLAIILAQGVIAPTAMGQSEAQQPPPSTAPPDSEMADFSGRWSTTYGVLELEQSNDSAQGIYSYGGGSSIEGTVSGNRFTFRYVEPTATGEGWFDLAPSGAAFSGQWREDDTEQWYPWTGIRSSELQPERDTGPFTGLFDTTYGRLRMVQNGDAVIGSYTFQRHSTIEGRVENGRLVFRYVEPTATGEGWFELSEDGSEFSGSWRADGTENWSSWTGERVESEFGVVWLVVLEAPWERSLAENEYAFGDMLRAYFQRFPHVRVRHRRFFDRTDFLRAMSELAYLSEPVALLIASHGQAGQLTTGNETIGADDIGSALANAPNVFLVHFSSCEVMMGSTPDDILAGLPEGHQLAISGYATSVDWSASALLEFLYLDLVLGRGMSPADAARAVRHDLNFAGDTVSLESPLGAAQFRFVQ